MQAPCFLTHTLHELRRAPCTLLPFVLPEVLRMHKPCTKTKHKFSLRFLGMQQNGPLPQGLAACLSTCEATKTHWLVAQPNASLKTKLISHGHASQYLLHSPKIERDQAVTWSSCLWSSIPPVPCPSQ